MVVTCLSRKLLISSSVLRNGDGTRNRKVIPPDVVALLVANSKGFFSSATVCALLLFMGPRQIKLWRQVLQALDRNQKRIYETSFKHRKRSKNRMRPSK